MPEIKEIKYSAQWNLLAFVDHSVNSLNNHLYVYMLKWNGITHLVELRWIGKGNSLRYQVSPFIV